jgi:hypothetical protein
MAGLGILEPVQRFCYYFKFFKIGRNNEGQRSIDADDFRRVCGPGEGGFTLKSWRSDT